MLHASGGLPYLRMLPCSDSDLYKERPVTFYSGRLDFREVEPSQRFPLPTDPAELFVALQRCLQDTQLYAYQPALLPLELLAARIAQTRAAPLHNDEHQATGSAYHTHPSGGHDGVAVATYKLSISMLGDATRTATAMSTQGYDLCLASALDGAGNPAIHTVGNLTIGYPFRHSAMPCGSGDKSLYDCHPKAVALTISLSNSTSKDAVPA
jgi:hypothetical protein